MSTKYIQGVPIKMHNHTSALHQQLLYSGGDRKFSRMKNALYFIRIAPSKPELQKLLWNQVSPQNSAYQPVTEWRESFQLNSKSMNRDQPGLIHAEFMVEKIMQWVGYSLVGGVLLQNPLDYHNSQKMEVMDGAFSPQLCSNSSHMQPDFVYKSSSNFGLDGPNWMK